MESIGLQRSEIQESGARKKLRERLSRGEQGDKLLLLSLDKMSLGRGKGKTQ
jgi:hypothetical protein